jgi:hypothetical protein
MPRNERIHIRDRHPYLCRAIRQQLGDFKLIEIARRVVVDRRPRKRAQVADVRAGGQRRWMRGQGGELLLHLRRELGLEAVRPHGLGCGLLEIDVRSRNVH